ncbi:MAG: flagellar FlbD family protein [Acidimicrobiales bacterium]
MSSVIPLSRLNGEVIALNPDLIERVEVTPDTVITLRDGTKYVVAESLDEMIERMVDLRARQFARAEQMLNGEDGTGSSPPVRGSSVKGGGTGELRVFPGGAGRSARSEPSRSEPPSPAPGGFGSSGPESTGSGWEPEEG